MCRTIFLFLTALCLYAHVQAQVPGYLPALNTAGTTGTSGGTTYTYSVGETIVFSNSCSYTPGTVQPTCLCLVPVTEVFDQKYTARFFPNPANSHMVVETDFADFANFLITALDGKLVESGVFDYQPVDLSKLSAGTYFLRLATQDNQIFKTLKIIKQ